MGLAYRGILFVLLALCALSFAYAVSGNVFYFAERDMSAALVKAYSNGSLVGQAVCNRSGYYSLELPAGDYVIDAQYYDQQEKSMLSSSENVTVLGNTRLDLILFPDFEDMPNFTSPEFPVEDEFDTAPVEQKPGIDVAGIVIALALLAVVAIAVYFVFVKNGRKEEIPVEEELHEEHAKKTTPESETSGENELQAKAKAPKPEYDDIEKVLGMIRKQRQISQGDIIRATNFSSAKVSLILKELEKKRKIIREKVGRMKIIRLRKVK